MILLTLFNFVEETYFIIINISEYCRNYKFELKVKINIDF